MRYRKIIIICAVLIFSGAIGFILNSRYNNLQYTIINPESIDFKYSKDQYTDAISEAEIEFRLKALSARVSLVMSTLQQLDEAEETNTFRDTQFTDELLYCDWINYGDSEVKASNTIEGKLLMMNNVIDALNHHNEEINVFIYGLKNNKVFPYKHIWKNLNKDVEEINKLIIKSNRINDTDFVKIHEIKSIGE